MEVVKGRLYCHKKTGYFYRVTAIANTVADKPGFPATVVYRGVDNLLWARPLSEFIEKFEPV